MELLKYGIRVNAVVVAECFTPLYEKWIKTLPNPKEKLKEIESKIPLENRMTTVEEIKAAIDKLSFQERCELNALLNPLPDDEWDKQMKVDATAGKFDEMNRRAEEDFKAGRCDPLERMFEEEK